jgi:hypothetical protein
MHIDFSMKILSSRTFYYNIISYQFNNYNHFSFPNSKISFKIKKQYLDYLSVSVTPTVFYKQCVNNTSKTSFFMKFVMS